MRRCDAAPAENPEAMLNCTRHTWPSVLACWPHRSVGGGYRKTWHPAPHIPLLHWEPDYNKLWWQNSENHWCCLFYCLTCTQHSQGATEMKMKGWCSRQFLTVSMRLNFIFPPLLFSNHWGITIGLWWWDPSIHLPEWKIPLRVKNLHAAGVSGISGLLSHTSPFKASLGPSCFKTCHPSHHHPHLSAHEQKHTAVHWTHTHRK